MQFNESFSDLLFLPPKNHAAPLQNLFTNDPEEMPPKQSNPKDPLISDDDEVLQAVILSDSFNKRFRPLTRRKPRVSATQDMH